MKAPTNVDRHSTRVTSNEGTDKRRQTFYKSHKQ